VGGDNVNEHSEGNSCADYAVPLDCEVGVLALKQWDELWELYLSDSGIDNQNNQPRVDQLNEEHFHYAASFLLSLRVESLELRE
jgi:hypothetical protein